MKYNLRKRGGNYLQEKEKALQKQFCCLQLKSCLLLQKKERERERGREEQTNEGMKKHKTKHRKLKTKAWKKDTLKK